MGSGAFCVVKRKKFRAVSAWQIFRQYPDPLQEYFLIALDVFRNFPYPKNRNEQTAWLSLLATEDVEEAELLVKEYPWLEEIYQETADLRKNPEEVLNMYSEALRILDRNTIRYMIEEQQKEIEEQQKKIEQQTQELQEKDVMIEEINSNVKQLQDEIGELKLQLARG